MLAPVELRHASCGMTLKALLHVLQAMFGMAPIQTIRQSLGSEKKMALKKLVLLTALTFGALGLVACDSSQEASQQTMSAEEFLSQNAEKEGVTVTASGLQYRVLSSGGGSGDTAGVADIVRVHYRGTLIDGTEFDSSYSRGEPAEFPVNRVIAGWTEALQLMREGDKWELVIPSDLAYGDSGAGALIGPGATLVFEVELIKIL